MEAKLDGLVTLLKSSQQQQPTMSSPVQDFSMDLAQNTHQDSGRQGIPSPKNDPYPSVSSGQQEDQRATPAQQFIALGDAAPDAGGAAFPHVRNYVLGNPSCASILSPGVTPSDSKSVPLMTPSTEDTPQSHPTFGIEPSLEEAGVLLSRFRKMVHNFPVVNLPTNVTAQRLRETKPFLYRCIMAVSCRSPSRQAAFGKDIMQYIAEHLLIMGEKNLDLLQGILVFAGWFVYLDTLESLQHGGAAGRSPPIYSWNLLPFPSCDRSETLTPSLFMQVPLQFPFHIPAMYNIATRNRISI